MQSYMSLIVIGSIRYLSCSSAAYADTVHWRHKGLEVPIVFSRYMQLCRLYYDTKYIYSLRPSLSASLNLNPSLSPSIISSIYRTAVIIIQ